MAHSQNVDVGLLSGAGVVGGSFARDKPFFRYFMFLGIFKNSIIIPPMSGFSEEREGT